MQFDSLSAFFSMGGYGFYVWLSYGVSTVLILALIMNSLSAHKHILKQIAKRQQREDKLRKLRKQTQSKDSSSPKEVIE